VHKPNQKEQYPMSKFINTLKTFDPTTLVASVLMFAAGLIVGQQTTSRETKKHYIADASTVEVIYHKPYKALTLDECVTEYECNIAQLLDDQANGRLVSTDDPSFYPDSVPVLEPVDCEVGDIECEKSNKQNAGKSAH
jgi:uncharacterized membrane protein YvbJ